MADRLQRGAKGVALGESLSGGPLPALLPAMRSVLLDGEVGIDGLIAVSGPLEAMSQRVPLESLRVADAVLAASVFHDGVFTIAQVKAAMETAGVPVRQ